MSFKDNLQFVLTVCSRIFSAVQPPLGTVETSNPEDEDDKEDSIETMDIFEEEQTAPSIVSPTLRCPHPTLSHDEGH
jgi:hypothetical protein